MIGDDRMHIINLKINDEKELYNSFDPAGDMLSEDVKKYFHDWMQERTIGESIEILLESDKPVNKERLGCTISKWAKEEQNQIKSEFRKNLLMQLWMFGIGVVFIALSLLLETKVGVIWFTVLSTVGAFSMWEAASI